MYQNDMQSACSLLSATKLSLLFNSESGNEAIWQYVIVTSQIIIVTSQIIIVTYYDIMNRSSTYIIIELVLHVVVVCIASLYHTNSAAWNWEHIPYNIISLPEYVS